MVPELGDAKLLNCWGLESQEKKKKNGYWDHTQFGQDQVAEDYKWLNHSRSG